MTHAQVPEGQSWDLNLGTTGLTIPTISTSASSAEPAHHIALIQKDHTVLCQGPCPPPSSPPRWKAVPRKESSLTPGVSQEGSPLLGGLRVHRTGCHQGSHRLWEGFMSTRQHVPRALTQVLAGFRVHRIGCPSPLLCPVLQRVSPASCSRIRRGEGGSMG